MKSFFIWLTFAFLLSQSAALAFPRFAQRIGASCQSCHVNPTGGGMRNAYGVTYGQETLPVKSWQEEVGLENFSTQVSDVIAFGADFRTRIVYRGSDKNTSFIVSEGGLYFDAKINKKLSVYLDRRTSSGMEVFGLARILPMKGYLKIGRFTPAYGIRFDDRNNRAEDTGFELGLAPGNFTFSSGIFNGDGTDKSKVFALRTDARFELGDLKASLGGSMYQQPSSGSEHRMLSAFGGASYSDFTVLGEADFSRDENGPEVRNSFQSFVEAYYVVTPGVDVKVGYDYSDPDVDLKTGSISAYTVGVEFFPIAGFEIKPLYRLKRETPTELDNDELQLLFHFYL